MWSRAATPRTSTTGSLAAKAASGREAPDQHSHAGDVSRRRERACMEKSIHVFCVPTEHPRMRRCQIWIRTFHFWKGRISFSFPKFARAAISFSKPTRIPTHNFILVYTRNSTRMCLNIIRIKLPRKFDKKKILC